MQSDLRVDIQTIGRVVTVALSGDLDLLSSPGLRGALGRLAEIEADLIVVDLRGVEFMDSTGVHLLVEGQQQAHDAGRRFVLIRGGEQVQRLLDLTGLADAVTIVDTPEQLLELDQAPGGP